MKKIITLEKIEKDYDCKLKSKIKLILKSKEQDEDFQKCVRFAYQFNSTGDENFRNEIDCILEKRDWDILAKPRTYVYYLCFIFMHPLTKVQGMCEKLKV